MSKWQGALVGADSHTMGIRVTQTEEEQLEELRRRVGARSKAQVIRMALDLLEVAAIPGTFMMEGPKGVRRNLAEHQDLVAAALRKLGLDGVEVGDGGLPADPAPPVQSGGGDEPR